MTALELRAMHANRIPNLHVYPDGTDIHQPAQGLNELIMGAGNELFACPTSGDDLARARRLLAVEA